MTVFMADCTRQRSRVCRRARQARTTSESCSSTTRVALTGDWNDKHHAACASSCLDCLRSYDNRRLHGALDWRLALDMLDLLAGERARHHPAGSTSGSRRHAVSPPRPDES